MDLIKILFIFYFQTPVLTKSQHWMKVITNLGEELSVSSNSCQRGMWSNTPVDTACICINGMWAISADFCDGDFEIFRGRNHCFPVNRMIRKFIYIGPEIGTKVFRLDLPYLRTVNPVNSTKCPITMNDTMDYMIRSNCKYPIVASTRGRKNDEICIPKNTFNGSVEISYLRGRNKFQYVRQCPPGIPVTSPFVKVGCGESWRPKKLNEIRASTSIYPKCSLSRFISNDKSLGPSAKHRTEKVQNLLLTTTRSTQILTKASTRRRTTRKLIISTTSTTRKPLQQPRVHPQMKVFTQQLLWKPINTKRNHKEKHAKRIPLSEGYGEDDDPFWGDPSLENEKQLLVIEQTRRIIKMHLNFLIHRRKYLEINKDEFILFRVAKNIFIKTCRNVEISKHFINTISRLFRYLVYESLEVFPYLEIMDSNEFNRTLTMLKSCHKGHGNIEIQHRKSETNCNNTIETILVNETSFPSQSATIPDKYKFRLEEFDFILESIWKIMSYAQYYCTPYFDYNPEDLSSLLLRWQGLISPVLKYRWSNPGQLLRGLKVLFPHNDLEKFAQVVDKCVTAAFTTYSYPHWFERPIISKVEVKSRSSHRRRSGRSAPSRPQELSPTSRNANANGGYCLQSYLDPIHKYKANSGKCLKMNNGN